MCVYLNTEATQKITQPNILSFTINKRSTEKALSMIVLFVMSI
jgi:hypothetical protein|tara:strand:+ start:69 stop:197 length:129 start_codon:yes stop_codon:yes gene_type:complete